MAGRRSDDILETWRSAVDGVVLPAAAPRPRRSAYPFGVVSSLVVVLLLVGALLVRGAGSTPSSSGGGAVASPSSTATPAATAEGTPAPATAQASQAAATMTSRPSTAASGECSAGQFAAGDPTSTYGFGVAGVTTVFVQQRLENGGADCTLRLPSAIGVTSAAGVTEPFAVKLPSAAPIQVRHGESVTLLLAASWPAPGSSASSCAALVTAVTRVTVRLGSDSLAIRLPIPWREACASPPSVALSAALS